MNALRVRAGGPLRGRLQVPGDKSISHRALLFNALSSGRARLRGLLDSEDVAATRRCAQALGAEVDGDVIRGTAGRLREPVDVLDCGNSGTTMRLLCGALAGQELFAVLTGDASLRRRPMGRVTRPLGEMGARFDGREGGRLAPLSIRGGALRAGRYDSPIASAQVKTAMILAALQAEGTLEYREPYRSRDHTERMLRAMGIQIDERGGALVVSGGQTPTACDVDVPGDISSAAFFLVAASLVPGSELVLEGVGLNPTRAGILDALWMMGADIEILDAREISGEPIGDLRVRAAQLRGARIDGALIPRLIDEIPVLAVAAALADGETTFADAAELRVKESDRIAATASGLRGMGIEVEERPDGAVVQGGRFTGPARVEAGGDHRIAMAFAVAALAAPGESAIRGASSIDTSFPTFPKLLEACRRG